MFLMKYLQIKNQRIYIYQRREHFHNILLRLESAAPDILGRRRLAHWSAAAASRLGRGGERGSDILWCGLTVGGY